MFSLQFLVFAGASLGIFAARPLPLECSLMTVINACNDLLPQINGTDEMFPDTDENLEEICQLSRPYYNCIEKVTAPCIEYETVDIGVKMLYAQSRLFRNMCDKGGKSKDPSAAIFAARPPPPPECNAMTVSSSCKDLMPQINGSDEMFPDTQEKLQEQCQLFRSYFTCLANVTGPCVEYKRVDEAVKLLYAQSKVFRFVCDKGGKSEDLALKLGKCYKSEIPDIVLYCGQTLTISSQDPKFVIKNKCKYNKKISECFYDKIKKDCGKDVSKFAKFLYKIAGIGDSMCKKYDD